MRRTLYIYTLPVVAGLLGLAAACSEGNNTAPGNLNEAGAAGEEGTTTPGTEAGGANSTATVGGGGVSVAATGGVTGNTAQAATGGSTASTITKCWDFVESTEGWTKNYASAFSLTDKTVRDETAAAKLLSESMADWVATNGYGQVPGFVQLTIPFATTQSEYQGLLYSYLPALPIENLVGKVIHAQVKLVSGMTADDNSKPSGGKLVIKTGDDYFYADGGWKNLKKNEWVELTLEVNNANLDQNKSKDLYDPTKVREVSVEVDTSGSAITENAIGTPGIVQIDHVCY